MSVRSLLQRVRRAAAEDFRQALTTDSSQFAAPDFEEYCRQKTLALSRVAVWLAAAAGVVWLPTDFFVFGRQRAVLQVVLAFRVTLIVAALVARVWVLASQTTRLGAMIATYLLLATTSLMWVGRIDLLGGTHLLSSGLVVPFLTSMFFLSARARAAVNLAVCALILLGYFALNPPALAEHESTYLCAFYPFAGTCSFALGHFLYGLMRAGYQQRAEIQQYARKLEEADRVKDSFVATVSHELRTPLNAILGMAEVLEDEGLSSRARGYVQTIAHSGELLATFIDDILTFARLKADKVTLEAVPYRLQTVVERSVAVASVAARAKQLALVTEVPPELPPLVGDAMRMEQILLNLLGNAVKFTVGGEVRLSVTTAQSPARLRIAVSDTGPGIPAEKRELVFEAFAQADATTTRRFGGTGLGLAIVRRLISLMGGTITVADRVPQGSVFTLDLPLLISSEPVPSEPEPAPSTIFGQRRRVLVVDDNADNRQVIEALLSKEPFELTFAENGRSGLALVQSQRFDAVLLDIEMPELDGYATVRALRAWEQERQRPPLPVYAVTAHGTAEHQQRTREAGFTGHVVKPVRKRELLQLLNGRSSGSTPALSVAQANAAQPDVQRILPAFLNRRRNELPALRERLAAGDFVALKTFGHNLKGSGAMYGLAELSLLGEAIELAAARERAAEVEQALLQLEGKIDQAMAARTASA